MAEEVRFFLRTALYSAVIGVIYWFASFEPDGIPTAYDYAGTTLLVFTLIASATVSGVVLLFIRDSPRHPSPLGGSLAARIGAALNRTVGLEHEAAERAERPLAGGPELVTSGSPWPIVAALAATMIVTGLVFGPWLLGPGVVLVVVSAVGWLSGP